MFKYGSLNIFDMDIFNEENQLTNYSKLCKKFSRINFYKFFGARFENKKLSISTKYFFNKYSLFPQEIINSALFIFFISFIISLILFLLLKSLFIIIFGVVSGYIMFNLTMNKLIVEYEKRRLKILEYIDLAFQEFLIILSTTKSIFDSIYFISQGNYPIISKEFRKMIFEINQGKNPEEILYEFSLNQPSISFKERLSTIIATNFNYDTILEELEKNVTEKENEYEKFTKQLDSKLILIIGICSFFPLLLTITILLNGLENEIWILGFSFLFWVLIQYLKKFLLQSNFIIFGSFETENYKESKKKLNEIKSEFEELILFLSFFGNFLKRDLSIERALIDAINKYDGILKTQLALIQKKMYFSNFSFVSAWENFCQSCKNRHSIQILNLIKRMLIKDSKKAGSQIISLLTQLKKNQTLIQKRDLIYNTQQFKIKIISLTTGIVLGLLISLSPIFSLAFSISNFNIKLQNIMLKLINYNEYFPLILMLTSILIISSFNLAKIMKVENPLKNVLTTLAIFGITWYFSYFYIYTMI